MGKAEFFGGSIGAGDRRRRSRRLITLIFAGRNRIIVIRRELPRTRDAGSDKILPHKRTTRFLLSVCRPVDVSTERRRPTVYAGTPMRLRRVQFLDLVAIVRVSYGTILSRVPSAGRLPPPFPGLEFAMEGLTLRSRASKNLRSRRVSIRGRGEILDHDDFR